MQDKSLSRIAAKARAAIIAFARVIFVRKWPSSTRVRSLHTCARRTFVAATHHECSAITRRARAKLLAVGVFLLASATALQVTAQDMRQIETELVAEVRIDDVAGPIPSPARFAPATLVTQGQVVYYTVRIRNVSSEYARNVTVTQRIPANTVYVADSASGPGTDVTFSIDGGQTFAPADELRATDAGGMQRTVPLDEYTHIRWHLRNALAPGAVALARFRAVFQ